MEAPNPVVLRLSRLLESLGEVLSDTKSVDDDGRVVFLDYRSARLLRKLAKDDDVTPEEYLRRLLISMGRFTFALNKRRRSLKA